MITGSELGKRLNYDPETGQFTWCTRRVGTLAGRVMADGYRRIQLCQKQYVASRLAFVWMTGRWPQETIDHINGDRDDNRWCNLREATKFEQQRNKRGWSKHGFKGVYIDSKSGLFGARIRIAGRLKCLGIRRTAEEAHELYCAAARAHFGAFARVDHIET